MNAPLITVGVDQSPTGTALTALRDNDIVESVRLGFPTNAGIGQVSDICDAFGGFLDKHQPHVVSIEDYAYHAFRLAPLAELGGSMKLTMYRRGYRQDRDRVRGADKAYVVQNQTLMKMFWFGASGTKKDTAYLLKVQEETGVTFRSDDLADSYMHARLTQFYVKLLQGTILFSSLKPKQQLVFLSSPVRKKHKLSEAKALKLSDEDKRKIAEL